MSDVIQYDLLVDLAEGRLNPVAEQVGGALALGASNHRKGITHNKSGPISSVTLLIGPEESGVGTKSCHSPCYAAIGSAYVCLALPNHLIDQFQRPHQLHIGVFE